MLPPRSPDWSCRVVLVSRRRIESSATNAIVPVPLVVRTIVHSERVSVVLAVVQLVQLVLTSMVHDISENRPIARRVPRVPHSTVPSVLMPFQTSPGLVHVAFGVWRYPVAETPPSARESLAVPSVPKSERIYPSVPGVCGLDGNPGLSGVMIELAHMAPTRTMSARGMRVSFFIIFIKYIYILCILRFPATCRVFFF